MGFLMFNFGCKYLWFRKFMVAFVFVCCLMLCLYMIILELITCGEQWMSECPNGF